MSPGTRLTHRHLTCPVGSYNVLFVGRTDWGTDTELGVGVAKRVAVVVGSNRPARICPDIAAWLQQELNAAQPSAAWAAQPIRYERVDLAEINLPFLDEPLIPALGEYAHEHTKAWSRTVSSYDGFVFVFPQYNWGYPAVLKNALDFLFQEWVGKPATYATYGTRGGSQAGRQLSGVLAGLHMRELYGHLKIVLTIKDVDSDWQLKDVDGVLAGYRPQIRRIDAQMREALKVPGRRKTAVTRPIRTAIVALRHARVQVTGAIPPARRPRRRPTLASAAAICVQQ